MDPYQHTQLPPATAPIEQYSFEGFAPFPNSLQPIQEEMESAAPVPSGNYINQGAQYAPARITPIAHYTGPVMQPNPFAPFGSSISQRDPFVPQQFALPAWGTEQVVQPTAPVPYANYHHQGGLYTPPRRQRRRARSNISTPGMVARTPGTISPAGIPGAATFWQQPTYPQMPAAQMQFPQPHLPLHQPQQLPAAPVQPGGHVCLIMDSIADQTVLSELCDYTRRKGVGGESCANVAGGARSRAFGFWRSGDEVKAKQYFQRQASKNLNQRKNRDLKKGRRA
jgi:hypothetical protein